MEVPNLEKIGINIIKISCKIKARLDFVKLLFWNISTVFQECKEFPLV